MGAQNGDRAMYSHDESSTRHSKSEASLQMTPCCYAAVAAATMRAWTLKVRLPISSYLVASRPKNESLTRKLGGRVGHEHSSAFPPPHSEH